MPTQSSQQCCTSHIGSGSCFEHRRARYLGWVSVSSLGQVVECDNSLTMNMAVEIRSSCPQSTNFSAFSSSPASRSLHPDGVSSQDGLSPTMGDRANRRLLPMFQKLSLSCSRQQEQHHEPQTNSRPCKCQIE